MRDKKNPYDANDYKSMQLRKEPYDLSSSEIKTVKKQNSQRKNFPQDLLSRL
jgi:hypothetical protein